MPAASRTHTDDHAARTVRLYLTLGGAALLILGLIFLDPVGKVACALVVAACVQGLWRGSADVVGMLLGALLAIFTAVPFSGAFEGLVRSVFNLTGLAGRIAATLTAGALVLLIVSVTVSILLRRLLRKAENTARWDTIAGGTLGALEGAILALAVTWTPVALAPIARAQIASGAGSTQAELVVKAADAVEHSTLASLSNATNPVKDARLLRASGDVLEILSNDAMREHFLASEVMREIDAMPSVKQALDIIKADKELIAVLESGANEEAVSTLVSSDTVLRAIDASGVVPDLAALAPRIAQAIEEARSSVKAKSPPPPTPQGNRRKP